MAKKTETKRSRQAKQTQPNRRPMPAEQSRIEENRDEAIPLPPHTSSAAERLSAGKALREKVQRHEHGVWKRPANRKDPMGILRAADVGRLKELLPIRYGRMLQSPFTFYRGSAAVMAADLAKTPATGVHVQACGDCHLLNFGGFATPERNILLDINDFDETLPAPWEWDVKRLVASFVLAARSNGFADSDGRDAAVACARSFRTRMREYSEMSPLELWYARIDSDDVLELVPKAEDRARVQQRFDKAMERSGSEVDYPQLAGMVSGHIRIHDNPPLIFHPEGAKEPAFKAVLEENLEIYRQTLSDDRRVLLGRYQVVDAAVKVVGIGSVGTFCAIVLLMSVDNQPLFLQFKEARSSVLEPYAGKSAYSHHGQRVVMGQRLTQPASDIFLGWLTTRRGVTGYLRQLRDAKIKPLVETWDVEAMTIFAEATGWALARAHAKSGDALTISGYLGSKEPFDEAMGDFALAYADQAERDHAALKAAVRAGKIEVYTE
jgi:hypothetical protein